MPDYELSADEFATALGVTRAELGGVLEERRPLGPRMALRLGTYFDMLDDLRRLLRANVDLVMVGAVKNRYVAQAIEQEKVVFYDAIDNPDNQLGCLDARAARGSRAGYERVLARVPDVVPDPGDELRETRDQIPTLETVTITSCFRVAIPKRIRERLGLRVGDRMRVVSHPDRFVLIPLLPESGHGAAVSLEDINAEITAVREERTQRRCS